MILLTLAFAAQSGTSEIWEQPTFGPGPHTLIIVDAGTVIRRNYDTGAACQFARDEIRRKAALRLPPRQPGQPRLTPVDPQATSAFCQPL